MLKNMEIRPADANSCSSSNNSSNSSTTSRNIDKNLINNLNLFDNFGKLKVGSYSTLPSASKIAATATTTTSNEANLKRQNDLPNYCTMSKKLKCLIKSNEDDDDDDDYDYCGNLPYIQLNNSHSSYDNSFVGGDSGGGGGLSNNLSTESIKNSCDYYADDDDDDNGMNECYSNDRSLRANYRSRQQKSSDAINKYLLEKLENRIANLNLKNNNTTSSMETKTIDRKLNKRDTIIPDQLAYCTMKREKITTKLPNEPATIKTTTDSYDSLTNQESLAEAFNILNELDEILANTEISSTIASSSASSIHSETERIEDCLYDLDNYLDEIDRQSPKLFLDDTNNDQQIVDDNEEKFIRSKTLPKKLQKSSSITRRQQSIRDDELLQRGHALRSTIASDLRNKIEQLRNMKNCCKMSNSSDGIDIIHNNNEHNKVSTLPSRKTWRRNSMRKTALLTLPEQQQQEQQELQKNISINENERPTESFVVTTTQLNDSQIEVMNFENIQHEMQRSGTLTSNLLPPPPAPPPPAPLRQFSTDSRRSLSQSDCTQLESLDQLDIVHDILNNSTLHDDDDAIISNENRPRQIGRRAEALPRIISIQSDTNQSGHRRIIVNHDRPMSAPAATTTNTRRQVNNQTSPLAAEINIQPTATSDRRYIGSETSSVISSRNPSPVSLLSSTASSSLASTQNDQDTEAATGQQQSQEPVVRLSSLDPENSARIAGNMNTHWPHEFSRILALLSCTLGIFNISRFAILTIHYGGNFLIQFLMLSIIFGIPMLWLQMCLGSKIKSGPVSMWKISPICRGIGIALCITQCLIALYSTISLSWILVYFRDSFVRKMEHYRWEDNFHIYRKQINSTGNLTETLADYFNGIVLQRWQLGLGRRVDTGGVRFQLAFNLAIIWAAVFLILCKGLKSYGKIVIGLITIPFILFIVITCKFLYILNFSTVQNIFSTSDFEDFLINSKTWTAAAQETFLTWVLLGPSVISLSSRSTKNGLRKTVLRRDAILVVLLTLFGLLLSAIFGFACVQILLNYDYLYLPGSYENIDSYLFLFSYKTQIPPSLISMPTKWVPHYSNVLGDVFRRPTAVPLRESGYQPLRLVTELFPAVVTAAQDQISSVWTVLGFLTFLLFGLSQLCAMWKPISSALGNSSSSVLLSCVSGLLLGIPFATEMGLSIIHYLDFVIGGAWWILILWTAQILGVFLIRGRPYNGDVLVNDLKMNGSMSAFLALSWNVLIPIGLVTMAVIHYKISGSNQLFYWRGKSYLTFWARKLGGLLQIAFLLLVPVTAIIQIYRYLSSGPPDILDRIQLLYRPTESPLPHRRTLVSVNRTSTSQQPPSGGGNAGGTETQVVPEDAPPKYTPPPSYTTATGARLAKIFRQSIRRSVRRILGETSRSRPAISSNNNNISNLPPEYSTVLTNPSGSTLSDDANIEIGPRALYNSYTQRTLSLERERSTLSTRTNLSTLTTTPSSHSSPGGVSGNNSRNFTALDVAQVLRSSSSVHRHERSASALAARVDNVLRSSSLRNKSSRSAENLVLNAAPLGQSNAIVLGDEPHSFINSENTSVI